MLRHISCHLGFVFVDVSELFSDRPDLAFWVALSRVYLRQDGVKHQTPKPRNSVFNNLAFISAQLRWGRTEPWFQQPKQFSVCSLREHQAKVGEDFTLFHNSWKKMSLSHDIICTLIWRTLTTCHSPVKKDYEIIIPLSELYYWNWFLRLFTLWSKCMPPKPGDNKRPCYN